MKLTQAADYAFRIILYLAKNGMNIVEAETISDNEKIPIRFLLKICRQLIMAGIIESSRGKNGGYKLARTPENITLKDVIIAVEGDIILNKCQVDPEECNKGAAGYCAVHHALCSIRNLMDREFSKYNFADLAGIKK